MLAVALGSLAVVSVTLCVAVRGSVWRNGLTQKMLVALVSCAILSGAFLVILTFRARAGLVAFIQIEMPALSERLVLMFKRAMILKETL